MGTTSRLVLLVGSGISKPAGLPMTIQLTETVLAGNGYTRHSSASFSKGPPQSLLNDGENFVNKICSFLAAVRDTVEPYFQTQDHSSNYEDLYYVCAQLIGHKSGNFE